MNKGKVIVRADGKVLNTGGCLCGASRPDVPVYASTRYSASQLPKKVDLRPYMTEIENQGQINSCTANATVGALEYLLKTKHHMDVDLSRLFVYYNARKASGIEGEDEGSCIYEAVESLKDIGICAEDIWPNEKRLVLKKPSQNCYDMASNLLISSSRRVDVSLDDFKLALAEGNPIIFGMSLFNSFDRQRRKGFVPMPSSQDEARGSHGSHAMLCVGYSDVDKVFIVRNSWGKEWGDRGYCYIPYGYMLNRNYNGGDNWIIDIPESQDGEEIDIGNDESWDNEDTWSNDDDSVLTELNDEFSQMDDEQWQAFNDAMGKYDLPYRLGALFATACVMDDDISDEEQNAAVEHLKKVLKIFNYKMDAEKVFHRCFKLASKGDFLEETVQILGEYLSPGALGTIAKNMYEIAGVDGLDSEEEEFIDSLVGAWLDTDEELEYNEDYDDEEECDDCDDYDDEDDYYVDDDEGWYDDEDDYDDDDEDDEDDDEDDEDDYDEDDDEDDEDDYDDEDDEDDDEDDEYDDEDDEDDYEDEEYDDEDDEDEYDDEDEDDDEDDEYDDEDDEDEYEDEDDYDEDCEDCDDCDDEDDCDDCDDEDDEEY